MHSPSVKKEIVKAEKRKISLNQIIKPFLFFFCALLLEIINFTSLKMGVLPTFLLFDFAAFVVLAGIVFSVNKNWLSNIFFFVFLAFQAFLNLLNATILKATDDVFFFELLTLTSEGVVSFDWSFIDITSILINVIFVAVLGVVVMLIDFYGKKKSFNIKAITKPILYLITFFGAWIVGITFYGSQSLAIKNNGSRNELATFHSELWQDMEYKYYGMKAFGVYGFYLKDFYNEYLRQINYDAYKDEYVRWIKQGETVSNENATLYGKNLIVICMESMDSFAIDPYNTPNLWKIINEDGVYAENFYSKNHTNISESIGMLGYVPKASKIKLADENALSVKYSLPNLFNAAGYQSNYFHPFRSGFYFRDDVNKKYGFDNLYFIEDADIPNKSTEFNLWNSEVDFFNVMKDKIVPQSEKPFFSFYMTVSAHGTYEIQNPNFSEYYARYDENFEKFKSWFETNTSFKLPTGELGELFKNFKSAAMDTDELIGKLIEELKLKNLYDSTAIVLYADHDCFYNDLSAEIKGDTIEKYHIPLAFVGGGLEHQVINDFTTVYNIYPTICELYGLPYNINMCHGVNMFNKDQSSNVMYSTEGRVGYFDQFCKSDNLLDIVKVTDTVTDEQVNHFLSNAKAFRDKQHKLNFIYKSKWSSDIL